MSTFFPEIQNVALLYVAAISCLQEVAVEAQLIHKRKRKKPFNKGDDSKVSVTEYKSESVAGLRKLQGLNI